MGKRDSVHVIPIYSAYIYRAYYNHMDLYIYLYQYGRKPTEYLSYIYVGMYTCMYICSYRVLRIVGGLVCLLLVLYSVVDSSIGP